MEPSVASTVYDSIRWIYSFLVEKNGKPKYLLDPLTTIVKLSMLAYKIPSTKIWIANHKLSFSEPSPLQGLGRWMMGGKREHIHYLYPSLLYFCHLKYSAANIGSGSEDGLSETLREVIDFYNRLVIAGLQALKLTYSDSKSDEVATCLDLYLPMLASEDETCIGARYERMNTTTKKVYDEFLKCWNKTNIEVITNLFKELEQRSDDPNFVAKTLEVLDNYLEAINFKIDKLRDP